jgi:hypothetical protein
VKKRVVPLNKKASALRPSLTKKSNNDDYKWPMHTLLELSFGLRDYTFLNVIIVALG